ncbi:hypothetical protein J7T55_012728 [Diaporthe amygdali]|uniref:uncharacterized protein n=1 Tax=Phomopsis amygdali TaxID=1214568 RepID=UPI0022FE172A|nr:uncharacterized protein J7T55_012728 [Diaporthe amygdali]KAJ0115448.1 hypothetical protein J7T55_012728 [Diaporthe amygdali]
MSIKRSHVHRRGRNDARDVDLDLDLDQNNAPGNDEGGVLTLRKRVVTVYETKTPEGWLGGVLTTLERATITQVVQQTITATEGDEEATPTPAETTARQTVDAPVAKGTPLSSSSSSSSTTTRIASDDDNSSSALPTAIIASTVSEASSGGALALASETASSTSTLKSSTAAGATDASAASATQSGSSSSGSGSSDAATKAGIAIGVLAGIFVVLGLVYFMIAKRKKQMREEQRLADDEKLNGPFGDHARAPPTPAKPPRLSLRPMTQLFLGAPAAAEKRASKGPQQNIAMVTSPTMKRAPGASAWERPMTGDSQNAHNPFGNHAETIQEEPPATPRHPASPMTPISEASMIPSPTFTPGLAPAPRASAITTDSAVLAPIVTHSPPLSPQPPQQGLPAGAVPAPLQMNPAGNTAPTPAVPEATSVSAAAAAGAAGAVAGGAAAAGLQRKQSVRKDNTPAPLDLTLPPKLGPVPPSPAGTEFSVHEVESGQAQEPSAGAAAIAAAGGPADSAVHRVQLDFKPTMDDEMELRVGQVVRLLHEHSASVLIDLNKELSPELVCLPVLSSPGHLSKVPEDHQSTPRDDHEVLP